MLKYCVLKRGEERQKEREKVYTVLKDAVFLLVKENFIISDLFYSNRSEPFLSVKRNETMITHDEKK